MEELSKARKKMTKKITAKNVQRKQKSDLNTIYTDPDVDKSFYEIEEMLNEKYGPDPYETSIDINKSDSDYEP